MNSYLCIVTCRNSQDLILQAISSLYEQALPPAHVIVVDDGSTDKTSAILASLRSRFGSLHVITNPDLGYDISRIPSNYNKALELAERLGITADYHLISTDDVLYDRNYALDIVTKLEENPQFAIASGVASDMGAKGMPRGAGRFVRSSFFQRYCKGRYPERLGYESYLVYLAEMVGFKVKVYGGSQFKHVRPLGKDHGFYEFGAGMKTLGYHPLFAIGRCLHHLMTGEITGRRGALRMLKAYLTFSPKPEGYYSLFDFRTREYVRSEQIRRIKRILLRP